MDYFSMFLVVEKEERIRSSLDICMLMSRRKQLHPKSLKGKEENQVFVDFIRLFFVDAGDDELLLVLPNELQYDEKVSYNYFNLFIICSNL